ncbi:hypothetical protein AYO37_00425 [Opitutia bacterium SCGC AG-212-L18]|nr:hypothetical protein AYO37_00425 [Opitutae bacterium SCGC AG-212-L18]
MISQEASNITWLDGHFIASSSATIPIATHALHYASSIFEGIRSYGPHIFKMQDHYERFHKSAQELGFHLPYSIPELNEATEMLVQKKQGQDLYIRPLAWCGTNKMTVGNRGIDVHVAIMAWERPVNRNQAPVRLIESRWRRPDPRTAPVHSKAAGLYMTSTISKNEAEAQGYDDALLLDYRGYIAEASSSNFFIVKDAKLITPIPHSFLNGITRLTVIDLANTLGISVEERDIPLAELNEATEAFLTGTAIEILPISEIQSAQGHFKFKEESITNKLKQAFHQLTINKQ